MNSLGLTILWMSVQIALFSLLGTGIFLLLRRRGPNAATAGAAAVLMLTLLLTALAIGPWPRWSLASLIPKPSASSPADQKQTKQSEASSAENNSPTVAELPASTETSALSLWWNALSEQLSSVDTTKAVQLQKIRWWQSWLPLIVIIGASLAFARLMAGIWALQSVRRKSTPIEDPELLTLVRGLAAELETPAVSLRETSLLRSAATIGWRRPLLLLPADWQSWTSIERRAVIAHELAHVARRDYLLVLVARFASAIHFYQPLVLWLNRQLRLQQELAADTRAAALLGSRQEYLTTLAQMALRADEQSIPWAARAFLPGTSALIKRVAWLKRQNNSTERSLGILGKLLLGATLAVVALIVAGIRGPSGSDTILAQANAAEPDAKTDKPADAPGGVQPFDLTYVPNDALVIVAVRPAAILTHLKIDRLASMLGEAFIGGDKFSLLDIEEMIFLPVPDGEFTIFRANKSMDWQPWANRRVPNAKRIETTDAAKKWIYFQSEKDDQAYFLPNDRTIVVGTGSALRKIFDQIDNKQSPQWLNKWQSIAKADAAVFVPIDKLPKIGDPKLQGSLGAWFTGPFLPIYQNTNTITLDLRYEKDLKLAIVAYLNMPEAGPLVEKTTNTLLPLAVGLLSEMKQSLLADPQAIAEGSKANVPFLDILIDLTKNAKVTLKKSEINLHAQTPIDPKLIESVLPALEQARYAARRAQSANNLKQLAVALCNYHAANKHFPASAIVGKDGKTKHSWRVEILPYLDESELYKEYRLDEPWDSKHNLELLDKMPLQFRYPGSDPKSTSTAYFMPTGKGTIGGNERGTNNKQITDGSSYTIALVEAKRDIYWTKPEDIEIELEKPLPKFGGYRPDGTFGVAFADGSVRAFPDDFNTALLKALFTIGGGEIVELPDNVK